MYNIRYWDNNEIHSSYDNLKDAKKVCRKLGHTSQTGFNPNMYEPVSFVSFVEPDGFEGIIYNPRFKVK